MTGKPVFYNDDRVGEADEVSQIVTLLVKHLWAEREARAAVMNRLLVCRDRYVILPALRDEELCQRIRREREEEKRRFEGGAPRQG